MTLLLRKTAFTLIELLVTVSIMLLLFSTALAAYTRYSEKQRVVAAAEVIETQLKEAQSRSKTGYLGSCDELAANNLRVWTNSNNRLYYRHTAICADGSTDVETDVAVDFNIDLSATLYVSFPPYAGSILQATPTGAIEDEISTQLSSTRNSDYEVTFTLTKGGGIQVDY
jgi:prepilin-type N-terminal cleavage/methylation domain-containing protein